MTRINLFHIGPQKCGTSWVYTCLQEHPEIACPKADSIHYFDMYHVKGEAWLASHFDTQGDQKYIDPTPSYIRSPIAAKRIHQHNPDAKIICCLRHPLERAFSHYWHEKKKGKYRFTFAEVLTNYDLFTSWVETGFYARHLKHNLEYFPREKLLVQWFDDLQKDPARFLRELCTFAGIDPDFTPSVLHSKINAAKSTRDVTLARASGTCKTQLERLHLGWLHTPLHHVAKTILPTGAPEEDFASISEDIKAQLMEIYLPEIERLEALLSVDLAHWKQPC